jgi:hypothetical protein
MKASEDVVFYGGAGGGGKSLLGMMKFLQQLVVENERFRKGEIQKSKAWGLYLRRKTPDLEQAVDESRRYFTDFDEDAKFNQNSGIWEFPSCGGAKFQFGHMQHEKDRFNYKSNSYTYVFFDELTEFTQLQFQYIFSRSRSDDPVLSDMVQVCAGSNPDGQGLLWVRDMFIEKKDPNVVYRTKFTLEDGREKFTDQIFIPAKLSDNPPLYKSGNYETRLRGLPPEIREAILNGNWYYASGAFLARVWDSTKHVCKNHSVPQGATCLRSGDYGYAKPASITWWYLDHDDVLTAFYNLYLVEHTPEMQAARIQEVEEEFGLWNEDANQSTISGPLDAKCWNRESSGTSIAAKFVSKGVRWYPAANKKPESRKNGAIELISRMQARVPSPHDPKNRAADRPMIRWMERCAAPIRTLPILRPDPHNPEDVDTDGDDHCYDETRYMCLAKPRPLTKIQDPDEDDVDNVVGIHSRERVGAWGR